MRKRVAILLAGGNCSNTIDNIITWFYNNVNGSGGYYGTREFNWKEV